MISKTAKLILVVGGLGVLIFGAGLLIWQDFLSRNLARQLESIPAPIEEKEAIREAQPVAIQTSDLDRPIKITANLSEESRHNAASKIQELQAELKTNDKFYSSWLELGIYRKLIGDYEAAEAIWRYVTEKWPKDSVAHNNLADLYINYLKDYKNGEKHLLLAIEKDPASFNYYLNAYEFYRYIIKDLAKARSILEKGLLENPKDASAYQQILADLNK